MFEYITFVQISKCLQLILHINNMWTGLFVNKINAYTPITGSHNDVTKTTRALN